MTTLRFTKTHAGRYAADHASRRYLVRRSGTGKLYAWELTIAPTFEAAPGLHLVDDKARTEWIAADTMRDAVAIANAYADLGDDYRTADHGHASRLTTAHSQVIDAQIAAMTATGQADAAPLAATDPEPIGPPVPVDPQTAAALATYRAPADPATRPALALTSFGAALLDTAECEHGVPMTDPCGPCAIAGHEPVDLDDDVAPTRAAVALADRRTGITVRLMAELPPVPAVRRDVHRHLADCRGCALHLADGHAYASLIDVPITAEELRAVLARPEVTGGERAALQECLADLDD